MAKWIEFIGEADADGNKYHWVVITKDGGDPIGMIEWYPRWRKYVFAPNPNTVYEEVCLRDIATFCAEQTRKLKEAARNKPINT